MSDMLPSAEPAFPIAPGCTPGYQACVRAGAAGPGRGLLQTTAVGKPLRRRAQASIAHYPRAHKGVMDK